MEAEAQRWNSVLKNCCDQSKTDRKSEKCFDAAMSFKIKLKIKF